MKIEHKYTGKIIAKDDGSKKLELQYPDAILADIQDLDDGQTIDLIIKGSKPTRSTQMNRYLWGVLYKRISTELNHQNTFDRVTDSEFVHYICKSLFIGTELIKVSHDIEVTIPETTTKMNNPEFIQYIENIRAWALEFLNLDLPLPNEEFIQTEQIKIEK